MSVRKVLFASVCSALLAALAAVPASHAAARNSAALAGQAYKALAKGDTATAIAQYSTAIESRELAPAILANALLNRGLAHQQAGLFENAIDDYSAALRIDALSAKLRATSLFNRGLAYQKIKRPALAIEDFTSALFMDSEFSHAYYSRGQALRESGQYLFALSDFEKALRYGHPMPHLVFYGEALTYEDLRRPELAEKSIAKALAAKADYAPALKKQAELAGQAPEAPVKVADAMVTGSITEGAADQVVKKEELPAAVAPPSQLLETASVAAPAKKLYDDRVPEGDALIVPAYAKAEAQKPKQAEAVKAEVAAIEAPAAAEPPEADVAVAKAIETSAPLSGWSIQLSSAAQEDLAWGTWKKLQSRHKVLAGQKAVVVKADLGKKGVFYRLRLAGYEDQGAAKAVCSRLKAKGLSCFVSKAAS